MDENKNENHEFEELVNEENYTKNNKKEKIILFSAIGIILVFTLVLIVIFTIFNKNYDLTINYEIPNSIVRENIEKINVKLTGNKEYSLDFNLDESIVLENIKSGNYNVVLSVLNQESLKSYQGEKEVFLDDNKTINIELSKPSIKYSIDHTWVGDTLNVDLPEGYDEYLVYKKDGNQYFLFNSFDKNSFSINNLENYNDFRFSVVKNEQIYEYSKSYEISSNTPPETPEIKGISNGETVDPLNSINITFNSSDKENDEILYTVTLKSSKNTKNIQTRSRNKKIRLEDLEYETNYTLEVKASDGNSETKNTIDFTTRNLPEKTYLYSPSGREGVTIYEVIDPRNPEEINTIDVGGTVKDVVKDRNYIYILRDSEGINIANVSNPSNPKMIKSIELDDIDKITIANNYLYVRFNDDRVGVYSIESLENPEFLGFTEIKYYGSENPDIRYINTNEEYKSTIIENSYQISARDQRVTVEEYSLVVNTESLKQFIENNYLKVFDNLRLVFSMNNYDEFQSVKGMEKIKSQLKTAIIEMYNKQDDSEIKQVILKVQ
ncbi:MAG: hypothetical protein ACQESN_00870 [Thermotogota bacterium]